MVDYSSLPDEMRLYDLNSESAVYVAACSLEEAEEHYLRLSGLSRRDAIAGPREILREDWGSLKFYDEETDQHYPASEFLVRAVTGADSLPMFLGQEDY